MKTPAIILTIILSATALAVSGQTTDPKADNTRINKRDRKPGEATADQQKMNAGDRDLTQKIRQAIFADKSLSTYAHNIKVISQDGVVTLKGPVHSEDEKQSILAKATQIAGGTSKVIDEVSIKQ
jgi:hyperosmotically inducible periplasmic protein